MFWLRFCAFIGLSWLLASACNGDVLVGKFEPIATGSGGTVGTLTTSTDGGTAGASSEVECIETPCEGNQQPYACGDCIDNDGDDRIDSMDPDCLGPCHDNEGSLYGALPGQDVEGCTKDCYFDRGAGAGNDGCAWNHQCDEREPSGPECAYDPEAGVGSPPRSCQEGSQQPQQCLDVCLELVPNGCDCFGCCQFEGVDTPVFVGSKADGQPSCTRDALTNPERCKPCTQVTSCLNRCDECELCVAQTELSAGSDCESQGGEPPQRCQMGLQACGLAGQEPCPRDYFCITGCCVLVVK